MRLRMAILLLPAAEKAFAMPAPMPVPPPVITTVLPCTESSGREGEMAGYGLLCHTLVREGKGGVAMSDGESNVESWLDRVSVVEMKNWVELGL